MVIFITNYVVTQYNLINMYIYNINKCYLVIGSSCITYFPMNKCILIIYAFDLTIDNQSLLWRKYFSLHQNFCFTYLLWKCEIVRTSSYCFEVQRKCRKTKQTPNFNVDKRNSTSVKTVIIPIKNRLLCKDIFFENFQSIKIFYCP